MEGRSPKRPLKFTRLRNEEPIQFLDQPTGAGNPQTTSRHVLEDKPSLTAIKHAYNMQDPRPAGQDPRSPSSKLSRLAGMNKGLHASSRSNSPASSVRVRREPRRFYLMKEHSSSSSGAPYHGVTKRRYTPRAHGLRPGLAIFAAESEASLKRMNQSSNYTMHDSMPATDLSVEISNGAQEQYRRPIRRPNATSEERRWRDENWNTGSSRTAPAIRDISMDSVPTNASQDDGSLALAADLQDFTLEQIGVGPSATEPARPFSSKYKPRPPPRRHIGKKFASKRESRRLTSDNERCHKSAEQQRRRQRRRQCLRHIRPRFRNARCSLDAPIEPCSILSLIAFHLPKPDNYRRQLWPPRRHRVRRGRGLGILRG